MAASWSLTRNGLPYCQWLKCLILPLLLLFFHMRFSEAVETPPFAQVALSGLRSKSFSSPNATLYKSLTLHNGILYVGGQERLFLLNPDDISQSKGAPVAWETSKTSKDRCQRLPQSLGGNYCYNFIRLVRPYNSTHLLLCGTMSLNPRNVFYNLRTSKMQEDTIVGTPLCSSDPSDNITSQRVSKGGPLSMFAATSRKLNKNMVLVKNLRDGTSLRTTGDGFISSTSNFVSSFSADDVMMGHTMKKSFFVFTENSPTLGFVTRIAQVCNNDIGGEFKKNEWTSLLKARLLCQIGDTMRSLQFDEATGITYTSDGIIYGTFTSKITNIQFSAVCAFKFSSVQSVFLSASTTTSARSSTSGTLKVNQTAGMCAYPGMQGIANATSRDLGNKFHLYMLHHSTVAMEVKSSVLDASDTVGALLQSQFETFVKIEVHRVNVIGDPFDVMYIATASGKIIKAARNTTSSSATTRQLAVYQVASGRITDLVLSSELGQLYVDTNSAVVQIPLANCEAYHLSCPFCDSCRMCVISRDPMCGWDPNRQLCVDTSNVIDTTRLLQSVAKGNAAICGKVAYQHSTKEAEVGDALILGFHLESPSSVKAKWFKNSTSLRPITQSGSGYHLNADGRLEFYSLTNADFGSYLCKYYVNNVLVAKSEIRVKKPTATPTDGAGSSLGTSDGVQTSGASSPDPETPTNNSVPVIGNTTAAVVPTVAPAAASMSWLIILLIVLFIVVIAVLLGFLVRRHGCPVKNKKYQTNETKASYSKEDLTVAAGDNKNQTNCNNKALLFSSNFDNKSDTTMLMSSVPKDMTDSVRDTQIPSNVVHPRKVATVPPMPAAPDSISYIDESEDAALVTATNGVVDARKTPMRTKSIPSRNVVVSLGNDLTVKCNSIKRNPKRGTIVVEVMLPQGVDVEDADDQTLSPFSLSAFDMTNGAGDADALLSASSSDSGRSSDLLTHGATEPLAGKLFTDTDSDSTIKAFGPSHVDSAVSSTASTPRQRNLPGADVSQPLLSSSYNNRLRNAAPSPRASPRDGTSPRWPNQKPASLRPNPARSAKSPTSSTSTSSASSSDKYHTPPPSPRKFS